MTTIGRKIKELRRDRAMSQLDVANVLGVTSQAVSKWETDVSVPDLELLPAIASLFGVPIDDLFEYSKEKEYEKIENMIEYQRDMNNREFMNAECFLLNMIEQNGSDYHANSLLGNLYGYYADCLNKKCVYYAKKALEICSNSKADMSNINNGSYGALYDWNAANHKELIDYWYSLLKQSPENERAYLYLIDNLIDAGRLSEAKMVLEEASSKTNDTLYEAYEIHIKESENGFDAVMNEYVALADKYANDWRVLFNIANAFSKNERYEEAISYWQKAFDCMEKPRYTDFYEAIAHCYIFLGRKKDAARTYKKELELLRDEWNVTYGGEVERIKEIMNDLQD